MKAGVANLDAVSIAEEKAGIVEDAKVRREIVEAPKGLGDDFSGWK